MVFRIVLVCMVVATSMAHKHNGDRTNESTRGDDDGQHRSHLRGGRRTKSWQAPLWRFVIPNHNTNSASPASNETPVTLSSSRASTRLVEPSWPSRGHGETGNKPLTTRKNGDDDEDLSSDNKKDSQGSSSTWFVWPTRPKDKSQGTLTVDTSGEEALSFDVGPSDFRSEDDAVAENERKEDTPTFSQVQQTNGTWTVDTWKVGATEIVP